MRRFSLKPRGNEGYLAWVLLLTVIVFSLLSEQFLTVQNLLDLCESYAVSGIFALGLFVVLVTGGIDISFAAVASVVQYLIATLATHYGLASPMGSILLALAIGAALGMVNALLIYCLRIVSIIVTISMQALLFGMLMWLTNGRSLYALPDWWTLPRSVLPFQLGEQSYQLGLPTLVMLAVALLTWLLLNKTRLGMNVRAVTQNRAMAACCGVPTGRVDMLAFGLGSGIAGLGGVALSQLGNVGPELGQGYIIDSFLVVVLGGVGQLAGTVAAAFGLGIVNKILEPQIGAVLGKILILVLIVLFIQKRPQGLFALKGRVID
ncbi:ABC transporter permease [Serratia nevei]|uniref:ABC transporter permease subunit n=1 Tax=Serratia nevei TaxID=2703794 RepID=UPI0027E4957E|nr:ABC transporter permease [Serratia nevei]MDQ7769162.1 ABC transporter permease [Serratia nevei]